jgi:hypothetical protein
VGCVSWDGIGCAIQDPTLTWGIVLFNMKTTMTTTEASFCLGVGQLSDLLETDSGVHIILRVE